jgi:hypothetical protein
MRRRVASKLAERRKESINQFRACEQELENLTLELNALGKARLFKCESDVFLVPAVRMILV